MTLEGWFCEHVSGERGKLQGRPPMGIQNSCCVCVCVCVCGGYIFAARRNQRIGMDTASKTAKRTRGKGTKVEEVKAGGSRKG